MATPPPHAGNPFRTVLNDEDVESAKRYKYNGTDDSIFAKLFLRRWWDFCIGFVPMSVAPNLITFIGFLAEVLSFAVSMGTSGFLAHPIPRWNCLLNGVALFFYQTLDNLDGRQARRTGTSSPLGQFFDHGCDALTGVFELMKFAATLGLGATPVTFYFVFLMGIGFLYTSLEEYVLHEFHLGVINGPDEGLFLIAVVHALATLVPQSVLSTLFNNWFFYVLFIAGVIMTIAPIALNIYRKARGDDERVNRFLVATAFSAVPVVLNLFMGNMLTGGLGNVMFTLCASLTLQFQAQIVIFSFLTKRKPARLFTVSILAVWGASIAAFLIALTTGLMGIYVVLFLGIIGIIVLFDIDVCTGLSDGLGIPVFTIAGPADDLKEDLYNNDDDDQEEEEEYKDKETPENVSMDLFKDVKEE